jgi:hypothetical protein
MHASNWFYSKFLEIAAKMISCEKYHSETRPSQTPTEIPYNKQGISEAVSPAEGYVVNEGWHA